MRFFPSAQVRRDLQQAPPKPPGCKVRANPATVFGKASIFRELRRRKGKAKRPRAVGTDTTVNKADIQERSREGTVSMSQASTTRGMAVNVEDGLAAFSVVTLNSPHPLLAISRQTGSQ